jgi:DNA replicative helicase MCM subunit Mcm2 (Cdc46/Mcm family)
MKSIVGTCSRCGGTVSVATPNHGESDVPTCDSCGAVKKSKLSVIETEEPSTPDTRGLLLG